jgi:predicted SAM-dependent methyltransferase
MKEINVEFGAGGSRPPGWITHDIETPIEGPLPYEDGAVTSIRAEHVAEHVDSPGLIAFLVSCHRILKSGGMLRLCIPITGPWLTRAHARSLAVEHGHKCIHTEETIRTALWIAGFEQHMIERVDRHPLDHHWKEIGLEKDSLETCRIIATKI